MGRRPTIRGDVKRSTTLIVLAAAAVFAAAPAGAAGHRAASSGRLARLTRANHRLQKRVASLNAAQKTVTAELEQAQSQAAALQAQSQAQHAALQSQNAMLRAALAQRTAERDAARAQVASLQAELAAIPEPLAVAVEQVRREVAWAQNGTAGSTWAPHGPSPYPAGELTAVSALNYVVGHVSPGVYGYLQVTGGQLPGDHPDEILAAQAGFCGDAALTFAAIVKRLGYEARSVQFYFTTPGGAPDDHIAVEVYYDDSWHYFDPTFGVYWTDLAGNVLSIADVRNGGGIEHRDDASFTNLVEDPWFGDDDVAFETDPATVVETGQQTFNG